MDTVNSVLTSPGQTVRGTSKFLSLRFDEGKFQMKGLLVKEPKKKMVRERSLDSGMGEEVTQDIHEESIARLVGMNTDGCHYIHDVLSAGRTSGEVGGTALDGHTEIFSGFKAKAKLSDCKVGNFGGHGNKADARRKLADERTAAVAAPKTSNEPEGPGEPEADDEPGVRSFFEGFCKLTRMAKFSVICFADLAALLRQVISHVPDATTVSQVTVSRTNSGNKSFEVSCWMQLFLTLNSANTHWSGLTSKAIL